MVILKGFNRKIKKYVELKINEDGAILEQDWECIEEGSVKRYTGLLDINREMLWQDDEIVNDQNNIHMFIRFGEYEAYCPADDEWMKNIGFYVEAEGYPDMPLGETSEYARKVIKA